MVHKALLACSLLVATANCSNTTLGWGDDSDNPNLTICPYPWEINECYDLESEIVLYEPGKLLRRALHEVTFPPYGGLYRSQILCILATDLSGGKSVGRISVAQGGLFQPYVKLKFVSARGKSMHYRVRVYTSPW
ncbi:unnamed protein product [Acanthoscelides obtectus]|uniref:Uncharacterized protein n=1 Tax=Acanthoscelides obtectus TaxID=200917 RepID=A0A9P0PKZ5_ACAOB|nr:unnamed protein product [Acanthoscelides obtectus]CAK1677715.1 hypothetical protein AOBTE_LOCUS31505 [Acanthoscelides obtectus]